MGLLMKTMKDQVRKKQWEKSEGLWRCSGALHTFVFNGHITDDHEMSSALTCEVVFWALLQFPGVFVPWNNGIVEGHLALEGGRLPFVDFDVMDAFGEMNLLG